MPAARKNLHSGVIGGALAGLAVLGLIVYVLYHGLSSFTQSVSTAAVAVSDTRTVVTGQACVIRDEKTILADMGGVLDPLVPNGDRVSADAPLVRVYYATPEDAATLSEQLAQADAEISRLSAAVEARDISPSRVDEIRSDVYGAYAEMIDDVRLGRFRNLKDATDDWLLSLNRYGVLTGTEKFDAVLAMWQVRREEILRDLGAGSVLSSRDYGSGYFYHRTSVDGYEGLLSPAMLDTLTPSELSSVLSSAEPVPFRTAGKMVYGYTWYLAVPVSLDAAAAVTAGNGYEVTFDGQGVTLTMTLERVNVGTVSDDALLIFSCNRMPAGFSYERVQSVEVLIDVRTGFRIPESALVTQNGQTGVFVLDGSIVGFRRITVTGFGDGYVLAAEHDPEPETPGIYLSANDLLVLSGEGLYDGKILS